MDLVVNAVFAKDHLCDIYLKLEERASNLRQIEMSDGEDDPRHPTTFSDLALNKNVPVNTDGGYFLHAEDVCYSIRFFENEVRVFATCASDEVAKTIMDLLSYFPVIYAHCCQFEEREYQNRVMSEKSYGLDEIWVGRDYGRYLPGVYWLNLIPKSLLERHGIPEKTIRSLALSCELIGNQNYLIQLYPSSDGWQERVEEVDAWRETTPGVFYKAKAQKALDDAKTFMEASDATSKWK